MRRGLLTDAQRALLNPVARAAYDAGTLFAVDVDGALEWAVDQGAGFLLGGPLADTFWRSVLEVWEQLPGHQWPSSMQLA